MTWWCDISNTGRHPFGYLIKYIFCQIVDFQRNHRISKIVLCDNATSELSANTTTPDGNEKIRKTITLYVQYTFWRLSLLSLQD